MHEDQRAQIIQSIRDSGGELTFVIAHTATAIWRCLIEMAAEGVLVIVGDSDGSTRTFMLQLQEQGANWTMQPANWRA